jgi:hypothetical protein
MGRVYKIIFGSSYWLWNFFEVTDLSLDEQSFEDFFNIE